MHGGEHTHREQQHEHEVPPGLSDGEAAVAVYIDYLDQRLGEPLQRPLVEGFRWYLEDALAVDQEKLSADEQRLMTWLTGWDHWTVGTLGLLIRLAREQAFAEGLAARAPDDEQAAVEAS